MELGVGVGGLLGACGGCRPWWGLWGHAQEGSGAVRGAEGGG